MTESSFEMVMVAISLGEVERESDSMCCRNLLRLVCVFDNDDVDNDVRRNCISKADRGSDCFSFQFYYEQ